MQGQQPGSAGGHQRDDQLIEALELAVEELGAATSWARLRQRSLAPR
jgi:hypothetical protein